MAVLKNKTPDTRHLFSPDAPPCDPGGEVTVSDEKFADRAWPHDTWELVEAPGDGYVDESTEDAYLFIPAPEEAPKKRTAKKGDN